MQNRHVPIVGRCVSATLSFRAKLQPVQPVVSVAPNIQVVGPVFLGFAASPSTRPETAKNPVFGGLKFDGIAGGKFDKGHSICYNVGKARYVNFSTI